MSSFSKLKENLRKNTTLFKIIFPIYSLIRYPHFLLVGVILKLIDKPFSSNGFKLSVPKKHTSPLFVGSLFFGLSEEDEKHCIDKYLPIDGKILELGGCLGVISCYINKRLKNSSDHIVLEANSDLIPYLEENKDLNNCSFTVFNAIISENNHVDFFISNSIHSSSFLKKSKIKRNVKGIKIKELQEKCDIKFDTLIMDIEGGEYELLTNTDFNLLSIKTIIFEAHDFNNVLSIQQISEIEKKLEEKGFKLIEKIGTSQIWKKI